MHQGKVKWFNNAKGYGFIVENGCTEDLFVHFSSIQMEGYKTLKAGQDVTFEKQPSGKGTHAVNIHAVEQADAKGLDDVICVDEPKLDRTQTEPTSSEHSTQQSVASTH